jgi:hypothetical protein
VNPERFDELTRALATTRLSRWQMVKLLGAGLVANMFPLLAVKDVSAARRCRGEGGKCSRDEQCCSSVCLQNRTCACTALGRGCNSSSDCCDEQAICSGGQCDCPPLRERCGGTCCAPCQQCNGASCGPKQCPLCTTCNPQTGVCEDCKKCEICPAGTCVPRTCNPPMVLNPDTCECQCPPEQACAGGVCCSADQTCCNGSCIPKGHCCTCSGGEGFCSNCQGYPQQWACCCSEGQPVIASSCVPPGTQGTWR